MRHIGVDLHTNSLTVCFLEEGKEERFATYALSELEQFQSELKASDKIAVEATGNSNYFYDRVVAQVAEVVVVAPGQFDVIRRLVNKTDKNDVRALAFFLSKGERLLKIEQLEKEKKAKPNEVLQRGQQGFFKSPPSPQTEFSILREASWPEAILQIQPQRFNALDFTTVRNEKKLTLTSNNNSAPHTQSLEALGEALQNQFSKDIDDWEVDENGHLQITARASQKAKKLEEFLQHPDFKCKTTARVHYEK